MHKNYKCSCLNNCFLYLHILNALYERILLTYTCQKIYIHIYIHTHVCTHKCVYIYIYVYKTIVTFKFFVLNVRAFSYVRYLSKLFFFLYNTFFFAYVVQIYTIFKNRISFWNHDQLFMLNPEKSYCFPFLGSLPGQMYWEF